MPINYEGEMFEPVKNYLKKLSNSSESIESFGYDSHEGVPKNTGWRLELNNYCSNPDVYGIGGDKIYLCQGKLIKNVKGKLWEVIGQGISNRNYCDYLYIFFEKEYLEKIIKEEYFQDFESILKHFNIGLLVLNNDLQVEEVIKVGEQNAPEKNINQTKEKISEVLFLDVLLKKIRRTIMNNIKPKPRLFEVYRKPLRPNQPAFYIYVDEWQNEKHLYYFIKFYIDRVLIGINVSLKLMQEEFINRLLKNPRFRFTEYNGEEIDYTTDFKKEESKETQEFHESVPLDQSADDFFNDLNSEKSRVKISEVNAKLAEIIEKMDPEFLKTLVKPI